MLARTSSLTSIRILLISVLLAGCGGGDMGDLKTFVADAYKDKKPEIEPLPIIKPFTAYEYSGSDQNDPFNAANILGDNANADGGRESERPPEPLEEFPLDALKMVGTMVKEGRPWVIVKTSTGLALLASEGNYMGQNNGQITQISPERQLVVLSERVLDSAGRWVTREVQVTVD
jgi:type IV pilus assembly protein PilP